MNNKLTRFTLLLTAGLTMLTVGACSKAKRDDLADKTKDAYHDTKDAVVEGWGDLKSFTFEKRDDFAAQVKVKQAQFDAEVSKLRADYSEAKASASRKAAMDELKSSEADYKEKLAAMGTATTDTWGATRDNVAAAWDRLQISYAKARAGN